MLSDNQLNTIRELLQDGNKIQAVKVCREYTGQGLSEAKDLVDKIASGDYGHASSENVGGGLGSSSSLSDEQIEEINRELFAGRKIQAIKAYRGYTGKDLKDSKEFIDQIEAELRRRMPEKFQAAAGGCLWLLVAFSTVLALIPQMI